MEGEEKSKEKSNFYMINLRWDESYIWLSVTLNSGWIFSDLLKSNDQNWSVYNTLPLHSSARTPTGVGSWHTGYYAKSLKSLPVLGW